jgi:hypothetical protein
MRLDTHGRECDARRHVTRAAANGNRTLLTGRVDDDDWPVPVLGGPSPAMETRDLLIEIIAIDVVKFAGLGNSNQLHS